MVDRAQTEHENSVSIHVCILSEKPTRISDRNPGNIDVGITAEELTEAAAGSLPPQGSADRLQDLSVCQFAYACGSPLNDAAVATPLARR